MNHLKTVVKGIDTVINSVQEELYDRLIELWSEQGEDPITVDGFGRAYRNPDSQNLPTLEVFIKEEDDYKDGFYNDSYDVVFLFLDEPDHKTKDEVVYTAKTKIIFMLNLDNVVGGDERNDAYVQEDVKKVLKDISDCRFKIEGVETGIKNIFRGINTEPIKFDDLHPYHIFAIKTELYYYSNNC